MGLTMSERAAVTKVKAQGYARADRRHLIHPQIKADWGARIGRPSSVVQDSTRSGRIEFADRALRVAD